MAEHDHENDIAEGLAIEVLEVFPNHEREPVPMMLSIAQDVKNQVAIIAITEMSSGEDSNFNDGAIQRVVMMSLDEWVHFNLALQGDLKKKLNEEMEKRGLGSFIEDSRSFLD